MLMFTGKYKGHNITIAASGMGMPSIGIYSYELFKFYDVDCIIRVGSAGSYQKDVKVYDIINTTKVYSESTFAKYAANIDENQIESVAIETSCDETSVAVIKDKKVLSNIIASQIKLHQQYGGVVPELAARAHSENIATVLQTAIEKSNISIMDIDFVAYTNTPGLASCLHVGKIIAETIAAYLEKPLLPLLGLLVSGGHTQLMLANEHLNFIILGQTLDDAVGECYDKVARMLGLKYPGGPEIERSAKLGKPTYKLPLPKNDNSLDFSFSGLKSACANLINKEK
ncbi:uncharacterized protein LOC113380870, partial [Ctenocephalides felis]|uniref:uncharacterized protein LOC113380870 n=1 Tax=Ctenocephalides felis TaxID=7515 RepID=UPI000E6E499C